MILYRKTGRSRSTTRKKYTDCLVKIDLVSKIQQIFQKKEIKPY